MKTSYLRLLALAPAAALVLSASTARADSTKTAVHNADAAVSEVKGDAAKAALEELNAEIDQLDKLVDHAPTAEEKAAARARLDVLKDRRNDLRKTYVKARYDELKADIKAEASRLAAWTRRTFNGDEVSEARREAREAVSDARREASEAADEAREEAREFASDARRESSELGREARAEAREAHADFTRGASSAAAAMSLSTYKDRSANLTRDEQKAAVAALDHEIEMLEDRVDRMSSGAARDAAERRVDQLEDAKDELEDNFNSAEFNALVDRVDAERKALGSTATE